MSNNYKDFKWQFSELDFDVLNWHDCQIHAIALSDDPPEVLLDIDFILEWVKPIPSSTELRFWVAQATLAFGKVYDVHIDLALYERSAFLDKVTRTLDRTYTDADGIDRSVWNWSLECIYGEITFAASRMDLYIRSEPVFSENQSIGPVERGGYSFVKGRTDGSIINKTEYPKAG